MSQESCNSAAATAPYAIVLSHLNSVVRFLLSVNIMLATV